MFNYDYDGNLTEDATFSYAWDCENRLISVGPVSQPVSGDKKLEFAYDYMGRRVQKKVYTYDGSEWGLTADLRFVYHNWLLLVEYEGAENTRVRKYVWGLDLSRSLENAGGIGGLISMRDADGGTNYVCFYDANGNLGQLVDRSDGSVDAKYEYDAYGNTIASGGPYADDNPIRFSTKYFDAELDYADTSNDGLYYFGYRYYTSRPGRWITRDPLHELDTWNLYRFVWNDPCTACDPDGLQTTKPTTKPALFPCIRYAFSDTRLTRPHLLRAYVSDAVKATGTAGATTGFATEATFVWGRQYSKIFVCCVEGKLKFLWGEPTIATQIRTMGIPMELRFIVLAAQISVSWHNVEIIALMSAWEPADREGRIVLQKLAQRKAARPVPGQWKKHEAKPPKGGRRVRSDEFPCKRLLPPRGEIKKRAGAPPKPVPWP